MKYEQLGHSGIEVSKVALGCMGFGKASKDFHEWTVGPEETREVVAHALDLGITYFDTANGYSFGTSEEYLGRALRELGVAREDVVIQTKVYFNEGKLSREAILREVDGSLSRLGMDYLDVYMIHRFDYGTPIEETMGTLNELVEAGKVRALGASAMYGYQFHNMQALAEAEGWAKFAVMQNHYNLIYREDERELIPVCRQYGVALAPYSPLAGGHLARAEWEGGTSRAKTDYMANRKYDPMRQFDEPIVARLGEVAAAHGAKPSQVALAWLWAKGVVAPVVGATKPGYLDDAAAALEIELSDSELAYLEELYMPHPIAGAYSE